VIHVRNSRFGGEAGGFSGVWNFARFRYKYPVTPNSVTIESSYLYNAQSTAVVLKEIPNVLTIVNCHGLVDCWMVRVDPALDPIMTGKEMSADHLLRLFEVENIQGVKYTGMDFYSMRNISDRIPKEHVILSGSDERMVQGLVFGTNGAIGTTENIFPAPFTQMYERFQQNDIRWVMNMQQRVNGLIRLLLDKGDLTYFKAVMRYIGFDCGSAKPPFKTLTEGEYSEFARELDQFDDLFSLSR